jgi:hypothetical protein
VGARRAVDACGQQSHERAPTPRSRSRDAAVGRPCDPGRSAVRRPAQHGRSLDRTPPRARSTRGTIGPIRSRRRGRRTAATTTAADGPRRLAGEHLRMSHGFTAAAGEHHSSCRARSATTTRASLADRGEASCGGTRPCVQAADALQATTRVIREPFGRRHGASATVEDNPRGLRRFAHCQRPPAADSYARIRTCFAADAALIAARQSVPVLARSDTQPRGRPASAGRRLRKRRP